MKNLRKGFTLVEIMIVVLIIGVLMAIAVPNFMNARSTSQAKACIANLKQIQSAKEQNLMQGKAVTMAALTADDGPLKTTPKCPAGTAAYADSAADADPVCPNVATNATHVLP